MREYNKCFVMLILFGFVIKGNSELFRKSSKNFKEGPINLEKAKEITFGEENTESFDETKKINEKFYKYNETVKKTFKGIALNKNTKEKEYCVILKIIEKSKKDEYENEKNILKLIKSKQIVENKNSNVIELYNYGNWDKNTHVLVLEFGGESLYSYWGKNAGEANIFVAVKFITQIAEILQTIHSYNIIYLDLKLENLVIYENNLKIIDFGISKILSKNELKKCKEYDEECRSNLVINNNVKIGTERYMSPEHSKNKKSVSQKSDIYSFGILSYILLHNSINKIFNLPYLFGNYEFIDEKIEDKKEKNIALKLKKLIEECMKRKPEERPNATIVLKQLDEISRMKEEEKNVE